MSLIELCYEQINDNFYYAMFFDCQLVVDKDTGCFNATKLCEDAGKMLEDWEGAMFGAYEVTGHDEVLDGLYLPKELLLGIVTWILH